VGAWSWHAQAAAMKEVFTAASDGNEDLLKRCIADGTDVDGYKDEVRPPFPN